MTRKQQLIQLNAEINTKAFEAANASIVQQPRLLREVGQLQLQFNRLVVELLCED